MYPWADPPGVTAMLSVVSRFEGLHDEAETLGWGVVMKRSRGDTAHKTGRNKTPLCPLLLPAAVVPTALAAIPSANPVPTAASECLHRT